MDMAKNYPVTQVIGHKHILGRYEDIHYSEWKWIERSKGKVYQNNAKAIKLLKRKPDKTA